MKLDIKIQIYVKKKKKIELIYYATCLHLKIGITFLICCEHFFNIMIFIECK